MGLRQAYERVIKHQLELLVEEKGWEIPIEKFDEISQAMASDPQFTDDLLRFADEHLETFGGNYWND
ncbi:hypothetical protein CN495_08560 [Bacillus thuringiensis]|uniref:Uncharacterized protein n=1 Tax=Bacillus thuringiensis TaxID=1428 RepID=A0ABD6SNJ4_BACTU|nr:hypothetical protein [Bacillus thuringiensis]PER55792.1 hypothetical protein CN495_08560 [Bacillus thuringiensis]